MGGGSKLSGTEVQRLQEALLASFPTRTALAQMVRVGLEENLDAVAAPENLSVAVFELIRWAEALGRLDELVAAAKTVNPGNPLLRAFVEVRERAQGAHAATKLEPAYENEEVRALAERLERARIRRKALQDAGESAGEVDTEILDLRRRLREGGHLRAGDTLEDGRYLLFKQIGQGGFASVWMASDRERGERVAIKVLHPDQAREPSRRERFFRGARVMAALEHPAVVRVLNPRGVDGGYHYFVMELVNGEDLHHAVIGGRLRRNEVVPLVLRVGEALAAAHANGVVHRDVKPANILLNVEGAPRLTDFDLVAAKDTTGGTRTGALGTFLFMAPEQIETANEADARADVYGLGMTAIFCLHGGELPHIAIRRPDLVVAGLACEAAIKAVLTRAIEVEPRDRYADAHAFSDALRDALAAGEGRPVDGGALKMPSEDIDDSASVKRPEIAITRLPVTGSLDAPALAARQVEIDREATRHLPHLLERKSRRIGMSPFAFLRGSARLFYEILAAQPNLAGGPEGDGWLVGNMHLESVGSYRNDADEVVFGLDAFDDATIGPLRLDVLRFATSVLLAGRTFQATGAPALSLVEHAVEGYLMGRGGPVQRAMPVPVARLIDRVRERSDKALLDARAPGKRGKRRFVRGERYLDLAPDMEAKVPVLLAAYVSALGDRAPAKAATWKLEDAAFRVAGNGSLGVARVAVLVSDHNRAEHLIEFIHADDINPSPSVFRQPPSGYWTHGAERSAVAARGLCGTPPRHLAPVRVDGTSFLGRRLSPQEDKLDIEGLREGVDLDELVAFIGRVLGAAHARGVAALGGPAPSAWTRDEVGTVIDHAVVLAGMFEGIYLAWVRNNNR